MQDIGHLLDCRPLREHGHEPLLVGVEEGVDPVLLRRGDQSPELGVARAAVRQQQELVVGVELDQPAALLASLHEVEPATAAEDALDERLAQPGIVESAFFLDGHERKARHEGCSEETRANPLGLPALVVDFDPCHARAGRVLLARVAAQFDGFELAQLVVDEVAHLLSQIGAGAADQPGRLGIAHQVDRGSRDRHARVRLRANPLPLDKGTKRFDEKGVVLVLSVVANLLAKQAGANQQPDPARGDPGLGTRRPQERCRVGVALVRQRRQCRTVNHHGNLSSSADGRGATLA